MIRLKQKKAAEEKKNSDDETKEEAEGIMNNVDTAMSVDVNDSEGKAEEKSATGLKLLGIGGKGIGQSGAKKVGKRRSPGEIRIQKGTLYCLYHLLFNQLLFIRYI